ncbi:hypothetical protein M378DRAFT_88472 [Amanita muscaria Koide BX008]|uniref:Uncharacterized protein n=1 Tax=Amanita muscaria (strain Koide BX008) TaxID=946122 RepID=A0A0C2WJZ4_AMAMK|nr:hypothetical protein M378DRAFT_88472 [Amanita muscaria Koide BX008]
MSTCTTIDSNADVSGIGIRVNLYISMLLVAIIPETNQTTPLLNVLVTNAGISGLALLITAIVQTAQQNLSLYHAIFIIHILFFTGVLVAPTGNYKGNIRSHLRRAIVAFIMTYGSVLLFTGYAFYIWAKAPTFGKNSECNDQIMYVFFFASVSATVGWLRRLWMAGLGITLAMLTLIPLASCLCLYSFGGGGSRSSIRKTSIKVSKPLAAIYGVVMLELYEKRNLHLLTSGENDFTFGQIMALVQIISALNEVFHFLLGGCTGEEEEEKDDESTTSQPQQPDSTPPEKKGKGSSSGVLHVQILIVAQLHFRRSFL